MENKMAEVAKLDDIEKEYLSAVIKPFRDRIIYITKINYKQSEYIDIYLKCYDDGFFDDSFGLPYFKKGTMYKGMEEDKSYTLEELCL